MKQFSKLTLLLGSTLICLGSSASTSNTDDPLTFLGPTARLGLTRTLTENTAFSVAGEGAPKNFRIGGTLGWKLTENQRLKVSAEYLWQDITYSFITGDTNQWVNQGAIGAAYQYDLDYALNPQLDLTAYVSHAPSKSLSSLTTTFLNPDGSATPYIVDRRIAGSNAAGITPGITITPWQGGQLSAGLNYDSVHYDRKYQPDDNAIGFGGTIGLNQAITKRIGFGLGAEVRQPFNNYTANMTWSTIPDHDNWALAIYGNYLDGKETLPNTWNLGLSANYLIDARPDNSNTFASRVKHGRDLKGYKGEVPALQPERDNLLTWTASPAVYMPQVLAVPDQRITSLCTAAFAASLISPIPDATGNNGIYDPTTSIPRSFNSPTHFSGNNLTYSLSVQPPSDSRCYEDADPEQFFSIDPSTGVVTATVFNGGDDCTWGVSIMAANACGSVSDSFNVEIDVNA